MPDDLERADEILRHVDTMVEQGGLTDEEAINKLFFQVQRAQAHALLALTAVLAGFRVGVEVEEKKPG